MYGYSQDNRGYGYDGYGGGHGGSGYPPSSGGYQQSSGGYQSDYQQAPSGGYQGGGYPVESQYKDHQAEHYSPPPGPPPPGIDQYGMPIRSQSKYGSSGHYGGGSGHYGGSGRYESSGHHYEGGHRSADNLPPPPPSGAQEFGHGAPEGYSFQYSNCTGSRRALLIGINYFGQDGELRGCINDVQNLTEFLTGSYGYRREDMLILTDDQQDPRLQPTKDNILRAMQWLVADAQPNDSLFLHFSGHGGQTEDLDGDEEDGSDEVIYPVDYASAGHIVDDDIHAIVVRPLQPGVRLTAIFDSCHSGSVMDLPYIYSTKGVLKEPNLAAEAAEGLFSAFSAYSRGDMMGAATSLFGLAKAAVSGGGDAYEKTKETRTSPADVIMWSGSKDSQTSADATINNMATGAMSWAFISSMKSNPKQSYVQLLNSIRDLLEEKYSQKPQLSSSHPIDTDLLFIM